MTEEKDMYEKWYWKDNPQFEPLMWEILKGVRNHTSDFIGKNMATRFYTIGDFNYLIGQMEERFVDTKNPYWNFFKSIEYIRFTDEDGNRLGKDKMKQNWEKIRWGWDFVIDIDADGDTLEERAERAKEEAKKILDYYKKLNVPYCIFFSGNSGFHIKIKWEDLKKYFEADDYGEVNKLLGEFMIDECDLEIVDSSVWGDKMDLIRVPYSLHPKTEKVVLPLTDAQFENFKPKLVDPEWLRDKGNLDLYKRGLKKRDGDLEEFVKEFNKKSAIDEYLEFKDQQRKEHMEKVDEITRKYKQLPKKFKEKVRNNIQRGTD